MSRYTQDDKPRRDVLGGALPRWFSVLLLASLTWFGKRYADNLEATLREHSNRLHAVELWKARVEGREKP